MKKSFVYLVAVLMLSLMLCACGRDNTDGYVSYSPSPTSTSAPSMRPDVSPTIVPEPKTSSDIGAARDRADSDNNRVEISPNVSDSNR